jgi:hypothetical protein
LELEEYDLVVAVLVGLFVELMVELALLQVELVVQLALLQVQLDRVDYRLVEEFDEQVCAEIKHIYFYIKI